MLFVHCSVPFFDPIQHFVHTVQLLLKYVCKKDWVFLLHSRFLPKGCEKYFFICIPNSSAQCDNIMKIILKASC